MSRRVVVLIKILAAVASIYAVGALLLYFLQEKLIFPAPSGGLRNPADAGLADAERIEVASAGGLRLHGYLLFPRGVERRGLPLILLFHGNGENVTLDAPWCELLRSTGAAVAEVDYQGYGLSEGSPGERQFYDDGLATLAVLRSRPEVDPGRVVLLGSSIGSGVAVFVALEAQKSGTPVAGVILQSPFDSLANVAIRHFPVFPRFLLKHRFDSMSRIASIECPVLVMHGDRDDIVPIDHARTLHAAARTARPFQTIEGAGHNDLISVAGGRYAALVREFVHDAGGKSPPVTR
jgi:hypothetical protein